MKITRTSPFTGKVTTLDIEVTEEEMADWKRGTVIQEAMPSVSAADREFILTGFLPEEWDALFKDE